MSHHDPMDSAQLVAAAARDTGEPLPAGARAHALSGMKGSDVGQYSAAFLAPLIRENRAWVIVFVLAAVAVLEALALFRLIPLREKVPYMVEVEKATGRVEISEKTFSKFKASQANIDYFLRKWVDRVESVDGQTLSDSLPKAFGWTRGDAVREFEEYTVGMADLITKTPGLKRVVKHSSINYLQEGGLVVLRFNLIESLGGQVTSVRPRILSANISFVTPKPESADEIDNPIGLVITRFSLRAEQ
jgi:type IV secretory pathway component VirB8